MSRIIELTSTVIQHPELLQPAVDYINSLGEFGVVKASLVQDKNGHVKGGHFHLDGKGQLRGASVSLRFSNNRAEPQYSQEGELLNGHFKLMGDEDYAETRRLGNLIGDHYSAHVLKRVLENEGQKVSLSLAEDGSVLVDGIENGAIAASSY